MKKLLLLGTAIWLGTAGAASAADLAPIYSKAPPPPMMGWTGCYLGLNLGGGWTDKTVSDGITGVSDGDFDGSGFVGGTQGGCDYQAGAWVFGVQGMFDGTSIQPHGSSLTNTIIAGGGPALDTGHLQWLSTVTGRIGYTAMPSTLFYAKGGAAWVRETLTFTPGASIVCSVAVPCPSSTFTNAGWTVGGGIEHMLNPHWSVFIEYDYIGFANRTVGFANQPFAGAGPVIFPMTVTQNVQMAIVGVNLRFGH